MGQLNLNTQNKIMKIRRGKGKKAKDVKDIVLNERMLKEWLEKRKAHYEALFREAPTMADKNYYSGVINMINEFYNTFIEKKEFEDKLIEEKEI